MTVNYLPSHAVRTGRSKLSFCRLPEAQSVSLARSFADGTPTKPYVYRAATVAVGKVLSEACRRTKGCYPSCGP